VTVTNKVALVTGAGSGIGRATALKLLEHGYSVVLTGRRQAPLDELADEARQRGADALAVACDVGDAAGVAALFNTIRQRYGRLDVLFNNAGRGAPPVDIDELSVEDWRAVVDTNLTGVFLCTRAAFGLMKTQIRTRRTRRVRIALPTRRPSTPLPG
jgi:NAD(P)-dependent dehydrogenase (short-subunit alcohol dehydrogenase family)